MARVNYAHFYEHATDGSRIELIVFEANSRDNTDSGRDDVLGDLVYRARHGLGLKIDQAALAYVQNGRIMYYGNPNLTKYLANRGVPQMTHYMEF